MNNEKIFISEDDKEVIGKWYEDARHVTRENLNDFISSIMDRYDFDYGSYVYAITVCSIATAYACGQALSGYQASLVGLQFIEEWTYHNVKSGLSIRNWDDMLYPQYVERFEKIIPKEIWINLQKEAKTRFDDIINDTDRLKYTSRAVLEHLKSIADGQVPFGYTISED